MMGLLWIAVLIFVAIQFGLWTAIGLFAFVLIIFLLLIGVAEG